MADPITPKRGTPSTPNAAAQSTDDAYAFLQGVLKNYGLNGLDSWAWSQLQKGRSADEILISLYDQPSFKQRFPAIAKRRELGLAPISPAEYVAYEKQLHELMNAVGIDQLYSTKPGTVPNAKPGELATTASPFQNLVSLLLGNDVSMNEVATRIEKGFQRVAQSDPLVRQEFQRLFGVQGDAALAAYFLDPKYSAPLLEDRAGQAAIGGAARSFGFALGADKLVKIEHQGIDYNEAMEAFAELAALDPLFSESVGEGNRRRAGEQRRVGMTQEQAWAHAIRNDETIMANDEGLDLAFGLDGRGRELVERRRRSRLAAEGGGQLAQSRGGTALGLGNTEA